MIGARRPPSLLSARPAPALVLVVLLAALAVATQGAPRARAAATCLGQPPGASPAQAPGPRLRFGITPAAVAGQVGMPAAAKPESDAQTLAALRSLAPTDIPFVLRLNRLFWSDGAAGVQRFRALAQHYATAGFEVEVQVRYHPSSAQEGDITAWEDYVREVVRQVGSVGGVVGLQITNEVNFTASTDSSDGGYTGAKDALIAGVIAAHREAARLGLGRLRIGFNWFYRTGPSSEDAFWSYLGAHGGATFAAAVDWVGLDVYPGTFFPPADTPGGERDAVINALSVMRDCYLPEASITARSPIYVEENGYPTGPGRSEDTQRQVMQTMIGAFNDYRGTYHVSDYRWFNLRDADSSSPNFQQQFGLLHDDYSPKAAFGLYRTLVSTLSARGAPAAGGRPGSGTHPGGRPPGHRVRLALRIGGRRRRRAAGGHLGRPVCSRGPVSIRLVGADLGAVRRARLTVSGGGRVRRAGRWRWRITGPAGRPRRRHRVDAVVGLPGGARLVVRGGWLRFCARR